MLSISAIKSLLAQHAADDPTPLVVAGLIEALLTEVFTPDPGECQLPYGAVVQEFDVTIPAPDFSETTVQVDLYFDYATKFKFQMGTLLKRMFPNCVFHMSAEDTASTSYLPILRALTRM